MIKERTREQQDSAEFSRRYSRMWEAVSTLAAEGSGDAVMMNTLIAMNGSDSLLFANLVLQGYPVTKSQQAMFGLSFPDLQAVVDRIRVKMVELRMLG